MVRRGLAREDALLALLAAFDVGDRDAVVFWLGTLAVHLDGLGVVGFAALLQAVKVALVAVTVVTRSHLPLPCQEFEQWLQGRDT